MLFFIDFFFTLEFVRLIQTIICSYAQAIKNSIFGSTKKSIINDVILITGASKGIGNLMAVELSLYKPKKIILWGRTETLLNELSTRIQNNGVPCVYQVCDIGIKEEVYQCIEKLQSSNDEPTIIINNAGVVTGGHYLFEIPEKDFERTMAVNIFSHFWILKSFLPKMIDNNNGHIVDVSSIASQMGIARLGAYCASKAASAIFTECLRAELDVSNCSNVHVTSVQPYLINTDMFSKVNIKYPKLMRVLDAQWVAQRIVYGILTNENQILLPWYMHILPILKAMLPISVWNSISIEMGVEHFAKDLPQRW